MQDKPRQLEEVLRDEMLMQGAILSLLRESPKTVPELAEALHKPTREVTLWMAGMWRYGLVIETGKANSEGYFSYRPRD